jgi:hypothetical protein
MRSGTGKGRGRSRLEQELEQATARRPAPSRGKYICGKALGKSKRGRGETPWTPCTSEKRDWELVAKTHLHRVRDRDGAPSDI